MNKQVDFRHYDFTGYVSKARFVSFWHQARLAIELCPRNALEIGPGPGIVTSILRSQGISVATCDIADDIGVDLRASVLEIPVPDSSFDIVMCCQVLEHLPFANFERALGEIARVARKYAIISLPNAGPYIAARFQLPKLGVFEFGVPIPWFSKTHRFDGQHYWEVGKRGYSSRYVDGKIGSFFQVCKIFRPTENPYHRFYVCTVPN